MSLTVTYVGHATVLIELDGLRLLTDPILRRTTFGVVRRMVPEPEPIDPPDAILISHQHPDHLDPPSLRMIGTGVPVIAPRGSGRRISRWGMADVTELAPGETTTLGSIDVTATPADHDGRRYPIGPHLPFIHRTPPLGYEVHGSQSVYFAGDTDLFDEMSDLEGVDLAFLPIAGWGTRVGEGHLDPVRAARAAAIIKPRAVVPIHWGTVLRVDLTRRTELLTKHAAEFPARMAELAPGSEPRVLQPGEAFTLES